MYQKVFGWLAPQNSFQYRILRKLYLGVSGAVLFLRKGLGYLRRNGVVGTAQAVVYIYKQRPRKVKLDLETKASLGRLLARLDIQLDAHQVLSSLVNAFGDERTRQIMANAADVEKTLSTDGGGEGFSIVQASQLPVASPDASSKKILFITAEFPDHLHGGGNRVLNFIKTLSEYNEIYLATSFYSEENGKMLSAIEPYCRSILKIPHVRFGENQDEIKKWLNGEIIDIVHYEWPRSLENYDPDFGKRQIFTYMEAVSLRLMMDMENFAPLSTSWLECFEQLAYAMRVELVLASHLDARVAVTTKDGEFFRKLFPYREYAVLNHGLGFDDFTLPDIQREPHTIVFVGNYRHYPNEDAMRFFFDKIWGNIRKEISDARIYVVGTNPPEFIARMADEKHLFVTGTVPDVRPYIQKAAVCIAPLISGAGLRGKVIEYAALRRPFVATSIATTDLIFKDAVDYFCADTAEKFSQQVIALLKDPQLSRQMGDSAYETARQNYDNRRLTGFLLSLYEYLEGKANEKQ